MRLESISLCVLGRSLACQNKEATLHTSNSSYLQLCKEYRRGVLCCKRDRKLFQKVQKAVHFRMLFDGNKLKMAQKPEKKQKEVKEGAPGKVKEGKKIKKKCEEKVKRKSFQHKCRALP